jgi:hypothetical protein
VNADRPFPVPPRDATPRQGSPIAANQQMISNVLKLASGTHTDQVAVVTPSANIVTIVAPTACWHHDHTHRDHDRPQRMSPQIDVETGPGFPQDYTNLGTRGVQPKSQERQRIWDGVMGWNKGTSEQLDEWTTNLTLGHLARPLTTDSSTSSYDLGAAASCHARTIEAKPKPRQPKGKTNCINSRCRPATSLWEDRMEAAQDLQERA